MTGEIELNHIQNLKKYSHFLTKNELNKSIYAHLDQNETNLNKTDKKLLELISRYSVKNNGVAYLKVSTMANSMNLTSRTIKRIMAKLEQLKIIKRINTFRKVAGGYGANIIQILPANNKMSHREPFKMSPCNIGKIANEIKSVTVKSENETTSSKATKDLINTYYDKFKHQIRIFINNKQLTSKLYGIYLAQSRQILKFDAMSQYKAQLEQLALQAIIITMHATKRKQINNLAGYFNNTLSKLIDQSIYADLYSSDTIPHFQRY